MRKYLRSIGLAVVVTMIASHPALAAHAVGHPDSSSVQCQFCNFSTPTAMGFPVPNLEIHPHAFANKQVVDLAAIYHTLSADFAYFQRAPPLPPK